MGAREYSSSTRAGKIFSDMLNLVFRRGWFSSAPSADDGQSVLYVSFHVPPENADRLSESIEKAIIEYGGNTKWRLIRTQQNRFVLYPEQLAIRDEQLGDLGAAVMETRRVLPGLEREAARDLILLSDYTYESVLGKR